MTSHTIFPEGGMLWLKYPRSSMSLLRYRAMDASEESIRRLGRPALTRAWFVSE